MIKRYAAAVSTGKALVSLGLITVVISFGVFANLPHLPGLMIDLQFGYDALWVTAFLERIGEAGRGTYRWAGGGVDMIFPFFYASFFCGMLYRFRMSERFWWLALLPVLAAVVDWSENIQIQMMISSYPTVGAMQADIASLFTQAKWVLVRLIYLLVAVSVIVSFLRRFQKAHGKL